MFVYFFIIRKKLLFIKGNILSCLTNILTSSDFKWELWQWTNKLLVLLKWNLMQQFIHCTAVWPLCKGKSNSQRQPSCVNLDLFKNFHRKCFWKHINRSPLLDVTTYKVIYWGSFHIICLLLDTKKKKKVESIKLRLRSLGIAFIIGMVLVSSRHDAWHSGQRVPCLFHQTRKVCFSCSESPCLLVKSRCVSMCFLGPSILHTFFCTLSYNPVSEI